MSDFLKDKIRTKLFRRVQSDLPEHNSWNFSPDYYLYHRDYDFAIVSENPYETSRRLKNKVLSDLGFEEVDSNFVDYKSSGNDYDYPFETHREWLLNLNDMFYKLHVDTRFMRLDGEEPVGRLKDEWDSSHLKAIVNGINEEFSDVPDVVYVNTAAHLRELHEGEYNG